MPVFVPAPIEKKLLLYRLRIKFPIHDVVIQVIHARRLIAIMENSKKSVSVSIRIPAQYKP